jgi:hypothetical protein
VVSSLPAHQALDVSPDLDTITVNFSEEMAEAVSFTEISKIWGSSNYFWSPDHRSLSITRDSAALPLPPGGLVTLMLNPAGAMNFQDLEGNLLDTFTLSFTVAGDAPFQVSRISADPGRGFYWPYYLCVPDETTPFTTLLVEPNNTGTLSDDLAVHEAAAADLVTGRSMFAAELQVPLLVPVFPRPAFSPGMYTHALDRATLLSTIPDYVRIDLQLIAMIEDARQRLAKMGYRLDSKIFMMGFSASGAFTSRFTAIHPETVRAAAPGSPGGWPLAPVVSWNQIPMYYPVGHLDLEALIGVPVKLNLLQKVPQYIYVGGLDRNDALDTRAFPEEDRQAICTLLDCSLNPLLADRWPIAEQMHAAVNIPNTFVVYPGVAHTISAEMFSDLLAFFEAHKPSTTGTNPSIPLLLLGDP